MFLGHIAVGFAGKRVAPKTSFGTLLLAPLFSVVILSAVLAVAPSTWAETPTGETPPERTPPPPTRPGDSPATRLAPDIVHGLKQVSTAWIYEVDSLPSPGCTPRAYVLVDTILCHLVRSSTIAPSDLWVSVLTSALGRSSVRSSDRPFRADVGVRLLESDIVTDVLISAREHRILLATMEPAIIEIVSDDPFVSILRILHRALPKNRAIEDAIQELEASRARPGQGTSKYGAPLWPDCPPPPEEGEFVYYEDEPVPIQTPKPEWPAHAKQKELIKVTLHAFVEPSGRICYARVVQGPEPFASSAIEAVRHWLFKPALSGGKPVGVWVEIPFNFKP